MRYIDLYNYGSYQIVRVPERVVIPLYTPLDFDGNIVDQHMRKRNYVSLAKYLRRTFPILRDIPDKYEYSTPAVQKLESLVKWLLMQDFRDERVQGLTEELFASLHTYSNNQDVRNYFLIREQFYTNIDQLITKNIQHFPYHTIHNILCFLQRSIKHGIAGSIKTYSVFSETMYYLLEYRICVKEVCILLESVFKTHPEHLDNFEAHKYNVIFAVYSDFNYRRHINNLIKFFLVSDRFWRHYNSFSLKLRLSLLSMVNRMEYMGGIKHDLSEQVIEILMNKFLTSSQVIFETKVNQDSYRAICEMGLLVHLLTTLSHSTLLLSVREKALTVLGNKKFLLHVADVLTDVHQQGGRFGNNFVKMQKLWDHEYNPFKTLEIDLIILIDDLCWNNRPMVDILKDFGHKLTIINCFDNAIAHGHVSPSAVLLIDALYEAEQRSKLKAIENSSPVIQY